ncbi:hypothetical protein ABFA07_003124 [Porites harrisoni]
MFKGQGQTGLMCELVIFTLVCLWFGDHSSALPIGKAVKFNPTDKEVENVTLEDCKQWMIKYGMALKGQSVTTNEISKLQRRAGINVTGVLDTETKKLLVIPRCGVTEDDYKDQDYGKEKGITERRRRKRFTLQGSWWNKKDLTYRFLSSTADLPVDIQQNILRKMINKWAEVSTLTVREADSSASDNDVDILISFVRGFHNDPYPFDGQGGTLAHAYYPHNNLGLSGDAHFDDDERFTTGTSDGINLDWVAVHEFGHSMGLEHSNVRESIMYPWYKGYFPNIELTEDDILGIQALYGKPTPAPTTETPTTQPETTTKATTTETPTTQPETTTKATSTETPTSQPETTAKATTTETPTTQPETTTKATTTETPTTQPETTTKATTTETPTTQPETTTKATTTETPTTQPETTTKATTTETPTTQPETTTKATTTETPTTQPETTTKATTTETPTTQPETTTKATTAETLTTPTTSELEICKVKKFDSFVMGYDGKTYVFSGDYFWVLSERLKVESGPTKITLKWKEVRTPINSAYTNWDGRTVFFTGSEYWMYFDYRLEEGPRYLTQYGGRDGLPSALENMDAAFIWEKNYKAYFFKGWEYWRYDEISKRVDPGYPKNISIWGLPHPMDSVMSWSGNKRTYFFKDENYWRLNDRLLKFDKGYPRDITQIWMSCPT